MKINTGILREARKRLDKIDVPVEAQERLIDLLNLFMIVMDEKTLQDPAFSRNLVDVLADSSKLLVLIQHQASELDALKRISKNLTSSLDLEQVLDGVVREALHLVADAQDVHIYIYQDEKLVFGASLNDKGERNIQVSKPRPDGLTHSVARQKKLIMIEDMGKHPLYQNAPKDWLGSIIGIPLKMGTRVVGVMNLARNSTGAFSQGEIRLLTMLADQATIAIINARLHAVMSHQAHSDVLTELPNRRALDERLDRAISQSIQSGNAFGVVMMDLDGFKAINDTYGHEAGDGVLQQVAFLMVKSLRSTDFLARFGGDEWTLVLSETNQAQALLVTGKIQEILQNNDIRLPDGKKTRIGVSGGIALYPGHASSAPDLLRAADEALYRAKKTSRGQFLLAQNGS